MATCTSNGPDAAAGDGRSVAQAGWRGHRSVPARRDAVPVTPGRGVRAVERRLPAGCRSGRRSRTAVAHRRLHQKRSATAVSVTKTACVYRYQGPWPAGVVDQGDEDREDRADRIGPGATDRALNAGRTGCHRRGGGRALCTPR